MSENWFEVGMKVRCIADQEKIAAGQRLVPGSNYPKSGSIYTVRDIRNDAPWNGGHDKTVLLFVECDNAHLIGRRWPGAFCYVEPGFPPQGFRPLRKKTTSIELFTKMLEPKKVEVVG